MAYIEKRMHGHNLYHNYTLQVSLDEFDAIKRFEHLGYQPQVGEMSKKQVEISSYYMWIHWRRYKITGKQDLNILTYGG